MRLARLIGLAALVALVFAPAALALRFSDNSLLPPTGVVGKKYFHKLDGAGGCNENDYEFRIIGGTSLPPGLQLLGSSTDWRIEGVPTAAGKWEVWLMLWSDGNADCAAEEASPSGRRTAERPITISIDPGLTIQQSQANVPTATVGQAYGPVQFTAAGGGTQTWTALQIPAGLTLSPSGVLSGTPTTKSGDSKLTVQVKDTSGRDAQLTYNLPVRDPLALNVQQIPLSEVGKLFTLGFAAIGGNEQYTWETSTLPAGLGFDQAKRALTGTPTAAGTFAVKVTVKDQEGRAVSRDLSLVIAPKLAIATRTLRAGKVGKAYAVTFRKAGGAGTVQWRLIRLRPPAKGVTFDRVTGTLRFTPGKAGRYTIMVRVTDGLKVVATKTFIVTVKA
jgi:large repetitive protein